MRELKYRVWSDFWEKYADFEAELYMDGSVDADFEDDNGIPHHESTDLIIEQYTGLKDKNGEEIYEGDIIQEEIDFNSKMTDGTFRYRVYWDEEELCWCLEHIGNESIHHELWQCNQSTEVIGNIHENPELLEREDAKG